MGIISGFFYDLWFLFSRMTLHHRYFFHLFRKDDVVQLRTGWRYGEGKVLGEAREDVRGTAVPDLVRKHADEIGQRLHAWSVIGENTKIGERLYPHEIDYRAKTAHIGEIWTKLRETLPGGQVYADGFDLLILEPIWPRHSMGPMVIYKNLQTGEVVQTRMAALWNGSYQRKEKAA